MIGLIKAEFFKLKKLPFNIALFGTGVMLPLIGTIINANSMKQRTWESFINQNLWLAIMIAWPIYLLVLGSYMFISEKEQRTIENLFAIPVSRIELILSKIIVLFVFTVIIAVITYISNLFGLTLGFAVDTRAFMLGLFRYISSAVLMFGALMLVFAIIHLIKVEYFGAFIICSIYIIVSFVGMWNSFSASVLPLVTVLRFINCGYQITYAYPFNLSIASYGINISVYFISLFLVGYKSE